MQRRFPAAGRQSRREELDECDDELDLHELDRAGPPGKKSGLEVLYARYMGWTSLSR